MNGFTLMKQTYEKIGDIKRARIYDFLSTCDDDDICTLFDSTAFNDIAKGYLRSALNEAVKDGAIEEEQADEVRRWYRVILSEKTAKEAVG